MTRQEVSKVLESLGLDESKFGTKDSSDWEAVGMKLQDIIQKKGHRQTNIAFALDMHRTTMSNILYARRIMKRDFIIYVCLYCGVKLDEINELLNLAGYHSLSREVKFDSIILMVLDKYGVGNPEVLNDVVLLLQYYGLRRKLL